MYTIEITQDSKVISNISSERTLVEGLSDYAKTKTAYIEFFTDSVTQLFNVQIEQTRKAGRHTTCTITATNVYKETEKTVTIIEIK